MIALAPDAGKLEQATDRLEELTLLVHSAQNPETVKAELAWRRDTPREVDRAWRQPVPLPVVDELARIMGDRDDVLRNLDTHVDRYQQLQGTDSSWQPPGLDHDHGLDF